MLKEVQLQALTDKIKHDLQILAKDGYPYEICGLLHPHGILHQYPNTFCGDQRHGFDMEIDLPDSHIVAIWHSHPGGTEKPSSDDQECMQHLLDHGFDFPWIIVTDRSVTAWKL